MLGNSPHLVLRRTELQKLHKIVSDSERRDCLATLTQILRVAITVTTADKGNIQILDPLSRSLRIVVHEGFAKPFIEFFGEVNHRSAACGTALKLLERVIVEDVRQSPIFAGTEALDVMLEAGVQAVQSTPLIKDGCIVGMISTHYAVPTRPTKEQLHLLDELAGIAAHIIQVSGFSAETLTS